jgi:hypothetical protein
MRSTIICLFGSLLSSALIGCVTETRVITDSGVPGTKIETDDGDTTAERIKKSEEWVEQLAMPGVKPRNQRGRTVFLIKQLIDNRPQSTDVVLEHGIGHENPKVRENSAFFLSYAGDRRAEEALIGMLDDGVETVRLSAAASLVTGYSEKAGVPILLRALYSDQLHFRREAVKNLRIYSQMYFAFNPSGSRSERDFSAQKWEEWWRRNGDTFVAPVIGRPAR